MASLMRILFLLALLIEQVHGQITFLPIGEECNQTAVIEMMTSVKFVEDSPSLYPFVDASLCVIPDQPLANVTVTLSPFDDKIEMISFDQNLLIELQGNANDTKVWSVLSDDPTNITRVSCSVCKFTSVTGYMSFCSKGLPANCQIRMLTCSHNCTHSLS